MCTTQPPRKPIRKPSRKYIFVHVANPNCKVKFAEKLERSLPVISRREYSEAERQACWFTRVERMDMEVEREKTIERIKEGRRGRSSRRGLENLTNEGRAKRNSRRDNVIDSVMDELEAQWSQNIKAYDWDRFADISRQAGSTESKAIALELAKYDAKVAIGINRHLKDQLQHVQNAEPDVNIQPTIQIHSPEAKKSRKFWWSPSKVFKRGTVKNIPILLAQG